MKVNDSIVIKVIGIRYEINDPYICVIANLSSIQEPTKFKKIAGGIQDEKYDNFDIMDIDEENDEFVNI